MYTKEQIWNSFSKELGIIKHLAEKIPEGGHDHKPTEKQRTTLELLQYMSINGIGTMSAIMDGNPAAFGPLRERSKAVTPENFSQAIDTQETEMKALFESFTDELLDEEITLFGVTASRAIFILELLKTMTGYKMQLFLYAKAAGNEAIGTPNLWAGIDAPTA